MSDSDHRESGFLSGLILGVFVGVGLYYFLTTTEEGKKVKKQLKEKSEEILDHLNDIIEDVEKKGKEFRTQAKEVQVELEAQVKDARETVANEAQEGLSQIDKLRQRGRVASSKFFTRNGRPLS